MAEKDTATAPAEDETQDLHEAKLTQADQNWARMQPMQITASKERLDQPHQLVTVRNNHPVQTHIVIDRNQVGHELLPGQTKRDIDMLASEIDWFRRQRAPNRFDALGRQKPIHPVEIVGMKPIEDASEHRPQRVVKDGSKAA